MYCTIRTTDDAGDPEPVWFVSAEVEIHFGLKPVLLGRNHSPAY